MHRAMCILMCMETTGGLFGLVAIMTITVLYRYSQMVSLWLD